MRRHFDSRLFYRETNATFSIPVTAVSRDIISRNLEGMQMKTSAIIYDGINCADTKAQKFYNIPINVVITTASSFR